MGVRRVPKECENEKRERRRKIEKKRERDEGGEGKGGKRGERGDLVGVGDPVGARFTTQINTI
jgi:hypothetical protein